MTTQYIKHKQYTGSVEVSVEDKCFCGQIQFINDLVAYDGSTFDELVAAFEGAVESYIVTCAEMGIEPDKPYRGSFNVRVGPELHGRAAKMATVNGATLNEFVCRAISNEIREEESRDAWRDHSTQMHQHLHTLMEWHRDDARKESAPEQLKDDVAKSEDAWVIQPFQTK